MDNLVALYTTTDGRISRKGWWIGAVGLFVASIVITLVLSLVGLGMSTWAQLITYVLLFYPSWCIGIKRRHDRDSDGTDFKIMMGLSGLITLLQAFGIGVTMTDMGNGTMVPMPAMWMSIVYLALGVYGIYMLIQLGFLRGTTGTNTYGADPVGGLATA